ncbi:pilus assembly protein TadG-related protein [Sagittula sp. SSi028]|uniref:pilus assembly protein TadG-related protein n=1 Tax=Sagittula sp. SSi028 TaxID=3400636 RepID=UPI003AF6358F
MMNAMFKPKFRATASASGGFLGRFWAQQDGAMSYVALIGSLIMVIFGGIGIDMMHAELKRTKVQNTLDRAVLAAANLENSRDPNLVVEDYFRAMNMSDHLTGVDVDNGLGSKRVSADGHGQISSDFLSLIGVSELDVYGAATAENAVAPTEISLVLDVSGSMAGAKLQQLKDAAKEFVDTVLGDGGDDSRITVSIVPYNATVNIGPELAERFALDLDHTFSTCATFADSAFDTTVLSPDTPLEQIAHFDPINTGAAFVDTPWCSEGTTSNVIAHSADPDELKAFIDSLEAQGNTAIDLGMKWGTALLDPSTQDAVADMAAEGVAAGSAANRPASYEAAAQKFVVVMTDGQNTTQFDLKDYMKDPLNMSNVWVDDNGTEDRSDDRFSIKIRENSGDSNDWYYWPHREGRSDAYQRGPYSRALGGAATTVNGVAVVGGVSENDALQCSSYKGSGSHSGNTTLVAGVLSNVLENLQDIPVIAQSTDVLSNLLNVRFDATPSCTTVPPMRLNWLELFGNVKTTEYGADWYYDMYRDGVVSYSDYYNAYYSFETKVDGDDADARLHRICDAAKEAGVVVYAIGVEAPQAGLDAMGDCASSAAHFYDVTGDELVDTFSSISDMLVELRLTE